LRLEWLVNDLRQTLAKSLPAEISEPEFWRETEENYLMNARQPVREILLGKMMLKWVLRSKYPFMDRSCTPARARKNYGRLFDKYPEIAVQLGLNEWSAF
jgi:hypothetical protein